jgi:hypothetical protein
MDLCSGSGPALTVRLPIWSRYRDAAAVAHAGSTPWRLTDAPDTVLAPAARLSASGCGQQGGKVRQVRLASALPDEDIGLG